MRRSECEGRQRIPEDVRGAGTCGCSSGCGRGLLLAVHLSDLRLHAAELCQERDRLAFQGRGLLAIGDLFVLFLACERLQAVDERVRALLVVLLLFLQGVQLVALPLNLRHQLLYASTHLVGAGECVHCVHEALAVDENRGHRSVVGELVDVDEDLRKISLVGGVLAVDDLQLFTRAREVLVRLIERLLGLREPPLRCSDCLL